jgi:hypothetical protein
VTNLDSFNIRFPRTLRHDLERLAVEQERTVAQVARKLVRDGLRQQLRRNTATTTAI